MGFEVLLFVPNIIGYIRLGLIITSWSVFYSQPWMSVVCYSISAILDDLDGYAARKLHQTSEFGAWFDVVIDVIGRGMLWCRLYHFGYLVACLEWLTFVCTHRSGSKWKTSFVGEPFFVKAVMANNFKTPAGMVAIVGLHGLPIWLYCHYFDLLSAVSIPVVCQYLGIAVLAAGRALCAAVEMWCVWAHVHYLCSDEFTHSKTNRQESTSQTK